MENEKIPQIRISDNTILYDTKDVPIIINGEEKIVKIRKLTTGERNTIQAECSKIKVLNGQQSIVIDSSQVQEKVLSKAIVEAPFDTSLEFIKQLPSDVCDYLDSAYHEFAEPTDKKKD